MANSYLDRFSFGVSPNVRSAERVQCGDERDGGDAELEQFADLAEIQFLERVGAQRCGVERGSSQMRV